MGHIYKRGSIHWIQFYQDGQRVRMTTESTDEAVAKRMLKEHEARVTLKEPLVARTARVTYDELRADLVAHYRATESCDLTEAGWRLKHLDRFFRGARASQITGGGHHPVHRAAAAGRDREPQEENPTAPGQRHDRARGGGAVEDAAPRRRHNKVTRVPIVHKPEEAAARQGFLEPAQFEAIRARLPADVALIVTLLYDNASRLREVTHFQRTQVDLDAGCIRLRQPKTKTLVAVYLRPETLAMLRAHVGRVCDLERATGRVTLFPIFPGPGIPHTLVGTQRDNFERVWARARAAAGFPAALVHDLRRSGVRNLVRAGVPERVVMSISGHRSRSTFDRYNITSESDLQAAAATLDAARKAAAATNPATPGVVTPIIATRKARATRS